MASPQFDLLAPFGTKPEDKWFRTAYKWNRAEVCTMKAYKILGQIPIPLIFKWMGEVADTGGVVPGDQDARTLLKGIYSCLTSLSLPSGSRYVDATKQPSSHIARLLNHSWNKNDAKQSKFTVSGWPFRPSLQASIGRVPDWWSPYDLLGLFFSLLGPAPSGANKNNFYLPLTAVYGRWCSRIAGNPDRGWNWKPDIQGAGDLPYVFQCTWYIKVDESTKQHWGQYFLGASTAGDWFNSVKTNARYTGSWRERVQEARFDVLFRCQKIPMVQKNDFRDKTAPNMNPKIPGRNMVPYGNCAETYPFAIRFLAETTQNKNTMTGLALKRDFMAMEQYPEYDEFGTSPLWSNMMAPCANCTRLIENAGAVKSNFLPSLERNKAPKRPNPQVEVKELLVED